MEQGDWQAALIRLMAAQIRRYRQERKLSAQKLADRCAEIGFAVPRAVITNLENGHRETLSVAELLVLAAALEVPPILLVLPLGRQEELEILPKLELNTWLAADWWRGWAVTRELTESGLITGTNLDEDILVLGQAWDEAIYRLRLVGGNLEAVTAGLGELLGDDSEAAAALRKQINQDVYNQFKAMIEVRREMRAAGLIPPPLPPALAKLDDADSDGAH